jgi:poly(A) polymerase/tRNA nucleotidyltransferase (CCA-adding enzyme)
VGEENLENLFLLREADCLSRGKTDEIEDLADLKARVESERREARSFKISDLAIGGDDVKKALGLAEGPDVGRILQHMFEAVLDDPALNTREGLLRWLGEKLK